jgi:hypothetical protein
MRLLISGSREWVNSAVVHRLLQVTRDLSHEPLTLVEGCARGCDTIAENEAARLGIPVEHHPADWLRFGKRAGPTRNNDMVKSGIDIACFFLVESNPHRRVTVDGKTQTPHTRQNAGTRDCRKLVRKVGGITLLSFEMGQFTVEVLRKGHEDIPLALAGAYVVHFPEEEAVS